MSATASRGKGEKTGRVKAPDCVDLPPAFFEKRVQEILCTRKPGTPECERVRALLANDDDDAGLDSPSDAGGVGYPLSAFFNAWEIVARPVPPPGEGRTELCARFATFARRDPVFMGELLAALGAVKTGKANGRTYRIACALHRLTPSVYRFEEGIARETTSHAHIAGELIKAGLGREQTEVVSKTLGRDMKALEKVFSAWFPVGE